MACFSWGDMGMGQTKTTRGPQVLFLLSIYQGSIWGLPTVFDHHSHMSVASEAIAGPAWFSYILPLFLKAKEEDGGRRGAES